MLKNERQREIMGIILRQRYVKVSDLKRQFSVSDETIRRDLSDLEQTGRLHCVHGGAVLDAGSAGEFDINMRTQQNTKEKQAICQEAAALVNDGDSIGILGSTTAFWLGDCLENKSSLTVITNSIYIANKLSVDPANEVVLIGGRVDPRSMKTMGALAEDTLANMYVDKTFFSVAGVRPDRGLTEYTEEEQRLTAQAIHSAGRVILLSDHSKFGFAALRRIAGMDAVNDIVTDWNMTSGDLKVYEEMGIEVHRASAEKCNEKRDLIIGGSK